MGQAGRFTRATPRLLELLERTLESGYFGSDEKAGVRDFLRARHYEAGATKTLIAELYRDMMDYRRREAKSEE